MRIFTAAPLCRPTPSHPTSARIVCSWINPARLDVVMQNRGDALCPCFMNRLRLDAPSLAVADLPQFKEDPPHYFEAKERSNLESGTPVLYFTSLMKRCAVMMSFLYRVILVGV